jgi:hypothetical protein
MNYINASCIIGGNRIIRDGVVIFELASAPLPDFLAAAYRHFDLQYPKFYKMDTLSKLGWLAAELLLREFPKDRYTPEAVGLVLSNANASLDTDLRYWETVKDMPSPAVFVYTLPNIVAGEICIRHQWKGENAFFISPAFDAPLTHWYAADLLDNGRLDACVCGWVEVSGEYPKAALFLVEKHLRGAGQPFTPRLLQAAFEPQERHTN